MSNYTLAQESLTLVTEKDFKPYSYFENGQLVGIDIDIINEMAKRIGMSVSINALPWNRVLNYIKSGTVDGGFSAFRQEEREAYAYFIEPYIHESVYKIFVVKGREFNYNNIEDLYNKRLAKNLGYHLSSEFDKAEKSGRINIHEGDIKDHVERLTMKRTDGVIGNVHEVKFIIKEFYPTFEIVTLPKPVKWHS